jgi:hypothetical protein
MDLQAAPMPSDSLMRVARRLFWWMSPTEALRDRNRFLAQVMALGTWEDVAAVQEECPEGEWRDALRRVAPGVIDPRSWHFWHVRFGMVPIPPMPVRRLG